MTYRAIVRYTLNGDGASVNSEQAVIHDRLKKLGFYLVGAGTWNCDKLSPANIPALGAVLADIINVSARTKGKVKLDHVWSFVDVPDAKPEAGAS